MALCTMNSIVSTNVFTAIGLTEQYDASLADRIKDDELYMDQLEDAINAYLAKMTPHLKPGLQESIQNYYLQCVTDFERAGDHVYSICRCAETIIEKDGKLSEHAIAELRLICEPLKELLAYTSHAFTKQNQDSARKVEAYVVIINEMAKKCRDNHMDRMVSGICDAVTGSIFLDILMHIGRVADMCSNIAIHTLLRHDSSEENYEHVYTSDRHQMNDEEYNTAIEVLSNKYLKKL